MDIKDLSDQPQITLEELSKDFDTSVTQPLSIPRSDRNRASTAAMMSDDPETVVQTFNSASQELEQGTSHIVDGIVENQETIQRQAEQDLLPDLMVDESLPEERRTEILQGQVNPSREPTPPSQLLKEVSIIAPSPGERDSSARGRELLARDISRIDAAETQRQSLANSELMKLDSDLAPRFLELLERYLVPFVDTVHASKIKKSFLGGEGSIWVGNNHKEIVESLQRVPDEDYLEFAEGLMSLLTQDGGSIFMFKENHYSIFEDIRSTISRGHISDTEVFIDNAASAIELVTFTPLQRLVTKPVFKIIGKIIRSVVQPASTARMVAKVNPFKARALHDATLLDNSDNAAEALYGANKTEAIAGDLAPIPSDGNPLPLSAPRMGVNADVRAMSDPEILDYYNHSVDSHYSVEEIKRGQENIVNDFADAVGLTLHDAKMPVGRLTDEGISVDATYGKIDGGFSTAADALESTQVGLRKYGLHDDEITLLERTPEGYVPLEGEARKAAIAGGEEGDYLAQVAFTEKVNHLDMAEKLQTPVSYSLWTPLLRPLAIINPVLPRYVLDAASMFGRDVAGSAGGAVNRAAGLEREMLHLGTEWSNSFSKLPKASKDRVWDYVQKANRERLAMNESDLIGEGFDAQDIAVLQDWRNFWDTHYFLENADLVKTMKNRGLKVIDDPVNQSRFFGREVSEMNSKSVKEIYDPVTNKMVTLSNDEITKLYKTEGRIYKASEEFEIDGSIATHILAANNKTSYARSLRDSDQVLNYLEGYYSVQYKGSRFVRQTIRDKNGKVRIGADGKPVTKARAVAQTTKEADFWLRKLAKEDGRTPEEWGTVTRDKNNESTGFDDYWDLQSSAGRTTTRVRGQRLEDATSSMNTSLMDQHVVNPVDSMIHAARSISNRVQTRDWLESMKKRWMSQYEQYAPQHNGRATYPNTHKQIDLAGASAKVKAESKQFWEYINYMESGYVNGIDTVFKAGLQNIADMAGARHISSVERVAEGLAETIKPIALSKSTAFHAYLATSPARQYIVQAHQATQLLAIEPKYMATTATREYMGLMMGLLSKSPKSRAAAAKMFGTDPEGLDRVIKAFNSTGFSASIDKHNLMAGSLTELADSTWIKGGVGKTISAPFKVARTVGFNAGELTQRAFAYLTFRQRAIKKGLDADSIHVANRVAEEANNFTYNMNHAGDMPYNQNSWGAIFQFMQVPHKAMNTMLFNKTLTGTEKTKLVALNAALYGLPTTLMVNNLWDILPEEGIVREGVINGFEETLLNESLTMASGKDVDVSLASIAPLGMYGMYDTIRTLLVTGSPWDAVLSSPSGKLFGPSGRVHDAFKEAARVVRWRKDGIEPKKALGLFDAFMSISSGYSSYMVSDLARERGKIVSQGGLILDPDVSSPEAWLSLAGFQTNDALDMFDTVRTVYEKKGGLADDVDQWYKDYRKSMKQDGITVDQKRYLRDVFTVGWAHFGKHNKLAQERLKFNIQKDINGKDDWLFRSIQEMMGLFTPAEFKNFLETAPLADKERKTLLRAHDHMTAAIAENTE